MKALLYIQIQCPSCFCVMKNFDDCVVCENDGCELYHVQFERPSLPLIRKEDKGTRGAGYKKILMAPKRDYVLEDWDTM